jgi:hypothetical protein
MMIMKKTFLKNSVLLILASLIVVIGALSANHCFKNIRKSPEHTLIVYPEGEIAYPGLSFKSFSNHSFQHYIETLVSDKLRFRKILIKINSQIYFSLFKKTFAEDSKIVVGKHHQLFQAVYIINYCLKRDDPEKIALWAKKIKELKNFFQARGITFIYMITPSKAEYLPEAIPNRFHCPRTGIRNQVAQLTQLLKKEGVPYIDGASLMVKNTQKYHTPMFTRAGIHWNWLGASIEASELINRLNTINNNFNLTPLQFNYQITKLSHSDSDDDLLQLIKLFNNYERYLVPKVTFSSPKQTPPNIKVSIVGGSFNENLISVLLRNNIFKAMDLYFYYNVKRAFTAKDYDLGPTITKNPPAPAIKKDVLASDIVILEENSSLIASEHGAKFYKDFIQG